MGRSCFQLREGESVYSCPQCGVKIDEDDERCPSCGSDVGDGSWDEEDETSTQPCPFCSEEIYDDAEWCPSCRKYLSREDRSQPNRKPSWVVIGVLLALLPIFYVNFVGVWTWMFGR